MMDAVQGSYGGAKVSVTRNPRTRRITDDEVLAAVDLWMAEQRVRGASQYRIARMLRMSQQHVSQRLQKLPESFHVAIRSLAAKYPDGIPAAARDRIERGLVEWRRTRREAARRLKVARP